ncbi:serine hydrolase [Paenibacillus illinoisensis]|uniref:serine hydrolase n=1 Tax=Paenibacillus illinoisensis TaxID=59845 RepID=UPI003CE8664E
MAMNKSEFFTRTGLLKGDFTSLKEIRKINRYLIKMNVASLLITNMIGSTTISPASAAVIDNSGQLLTVMSTSKAGAKAAYVPPVDSLGLNVRSAVLMEVSTGEVLLNVNANEAMPPASMTKMMTEYIVAEQVKQVKISWDDIVEVGDWLLQLN